MRCINRHTAPIDGVAPGEEGDFAPGPSRIYLEAGLLEPCTGEEPLPPSVEALANKCDELTADCSKLFSQLEATRAEHEEVKARAAKRESEMQRAIDDLASQLATARERASKAEAERDGVRSRIAELEAQLALKSEPTPAPADAPAPEAAPVKKGKG